MCYILFRDLYNTFIPQLYHNYTTIMPHTYHIFYNVVLKKMMIKFGESLSISPVYQCDNLVLLCKFPFFCEISF